MSEFPSRQLDKFVIRLPFGMRELIGVEARKNGRTMNAEIVSRLEASLSEAGKPILTVYDGTVQADIVLELNARLNNFTEHLLEIKALLKELSPGAETQSGEPESEQ